MDQVTAFGVTLASELPVMLLLCRDRPVRHVALACLSASALTHPLAWHATLLLAPDEYLAGLMGIEAGVIAAEAAWYMLWLRGGAGRCLLWSAIANGTSVAIGWLLW